jgi:hypothetical protein
VRPRWVIALMIVMSGIGLALLGDLIPTAHKLDKWAALAESLIGVSLGLFGYPVFGRGAAIKPADDKQPPISGAAVVLVLAAFALSACALSPAGRAHVALATAADIGAAADKAISAADDAFQSAAIAEAEKAGSTTESRIKLAVWREKRDKARAVEAEYYAGLLGWQVALQVAENAIDKKFDFAGLIAGVTKMGTALLDGLRGLGIAVPGVK